MKSFRLIIIVLSIANYGMDMPLHTAAVANDPVSDCRSAKLIPVITSLSRPVALTHAGDGTKRLFITLQAGQILIHDGVQLLPEPFLDITSLVSCCNERGLFSVAFHPDYQLNGRFYVNYTNQSGASVIARYTASSGNANRADHETAVTLLVIDQPRSNHNGGQLQFGPLDGYLYIGMGDGGGAGDSGNLAQDPQSLLGKLLRIDVDQEFPYRIPVDNPFVDDPAVLDEIWAFGLRNPWRFSFDRVTGDLFIGDVGQGNFEEINYQSGTDVGGRNYGWRLMEGFHCFNPSTGCMEVEYGSMTLPILEYDHSVGNSVTGGYRYRGVKVPRLANLYLFADYGTGQIWGATLQPDGNWTTERLLDEDFLISSFGEDEAGELYVVRYSTGNSGVVYRIESEVSFDIDGDGAVSIAIDGLLIIRYLFGFRGDALSSGIVDSSSTNEADPGKCGEKIEIKLADAVATYGDVDGNQSTDALTDGLLILRYIAGMRGPSLIVGAMAKDTGTRTTLSQIEGFLNCFDLDD